MTTPKVPQARRQPRVGLFVTCLVDAMRPSVGFATLKLLREAGCRVEVPQAQTCCGQPAFNSGDTRDTATLARRFIATFEPFDYRRGAVRLLRRHDRARTTRRRWPTTRSGLAARGGWRAKTLEIMSFLVDVMGYRPGRAERSPRARPTTTAARACANSASSTQPRRCWAACPGWRCASSRATMSAAASAARSASSILPSPTRWSSEKAAAIERTGARAAARRRPRLPDEHGGQAEPARLEGARVPRRRGAGRNDRRHPPSARRSDACSPHRRSRPAPTRRSPTRR